ncbi:MAG: hypothetical protein ABFS56_28655 [Pseudomonadota bacterium]
MQKSLVELPQRLQSAVAAWQRSHQHKGNHKGLPLQEPTCIPPRSVGTAKVSNRSI